MTLDDQIEEPTSAEHSERPWLQWYEPGVPHTVSVSDEPLHRLLSDTASRYPKRTAVQFMGRATTFQELDESVSRFANALINLGVTPGDRVALLMPNCPQMIIGYYGTLRAGGVVVPTNPLYVESELEHQFNDAGVKVAVALSMFYPKLESIRSQIPSLEHVIVTNIKEYLPSLSRVLFRVARERQEGHAVHLADDGRTHWFQHLLEEASPVDPDITTPVDSLAVLQYTSGTTGLPKGAMLSHHNLAIGASQSHVWCINVTQPEGADVVLGVIPLFHIYAQTTVMNYPIAGGGKMVLLPRFGIKDILSAIDHEKPDLFPGVPAMYVVLSGASSASKYDLHSLRACISGSAPLDADTQQQFEELTGSRLVEGYGLTEAPVTHCNPISGTRKIKSIGIPIPSTDATIFDLETGTRQVAIGETGELAVRGPQVMLGYWNRPDDDAKVFRDGWFLTGDIGYMDEDGFFFIVERKKDMIITGGLKVFPSQVEEVIITHPDVMEVAVIGIPDVRRSEVVKAFIVLNEGASTSTNEIISFCQGKMANFKVPRSVEFRAELPKNMIGKVLRRKLVEQENTHQPADHESS